MTDLPPDRRPTEDGVNSAAELLAQLLMRNLSKDPALAAKQQRLLQKLAERETSSDGATPEHRPSP